MEEVNYKVLDEKAVMAYLENNKGILDVDDIINNSGANRLRVYPILIELFFANKLEIVQASELGSYEKVRYVG